MSSAFNARTQSPLDSLNPFLRAPAVPRGESSTEYIIFPYLYCSGQYV